MAGRQFEIPEIEELLTKGAVGPLQGFRSKQGFPFAAVIKMGAEFKPEFDFGNDQNKDGEAQRRRWISPARNRWASARSAARACLMRAMNYLCEKAIGPAKTCKFRSGKIILQQTIEPAQVLKLLATGKTDLLREVHLQEGPTAFEAYPRGEGWGHGV